MAGIYSYMARQKDARCIRVTYVHAIVHAHALIMRRPFPSMAIFGPGDSLSLSLPVRTLNAKRIARGDESSYLLVVAISSADPRRAAQRIQSSFSAGSRAEGPRRGANGAFVSQEGE